MNRKIIIAFLLANISLLFAQNQNEKIVFKNELAQIIQTNDSIKISNNYFDDISRRFIKKEIELNIEDIKQDENKYLVREGFLKEFLCKYTWGEESYSREINERFGILTKDDMKYGESRDKQCWSIADTTKFKECIMAVSSED